MRQQIKSNMLFFILPFIMLVHVVPASAQTPTSVLPGAGRPVAIGATSARRSHLMDRIERGVIAVPAAGMRDIEVIVVQDNDFRQDDYFFYLTGLETPDAWLVMAVGEDERQTILFLPERNPDREHWTGIRLGPGADAASLSGIDETVVLDSLDAYLRRLRRANRGPLYTLLYGPAERHDRIADWVFAGIDVRNVTPVLDSLRVVKDEAELQSLRRAIEITMDGHRAAMRSIAAGLHEYQLEATIEYTFRSLGADRVGFPSIVGSGPNSTTLHYDVNRRRIEEGDLVVLDIGAEYGQYTADITRTIPASGRFTDRQKAIYDIVLGTQQAAIDAVRPGVTVRELNQVARSYMEENSGSLCGEESCSRYYTTGLSHWLGMRVHDVGDYSMPLEPGMVLTIEPGIYIQEEELGVRIEDDVLVTEHGAVILSGALPRATEEIEALMATGSASGR